MITLDKVKVGGIFVIADFLQSDNRWNMRLMELGLTIGQKVRVIAKSAMKKAVLLQIRGYLLSVRTSMLANVVVK